MRRAALLLILAAATACLGERSQLLAGKACDDEDACADGFVCRDRVCIPEGQAAAQGVPDGGSDTSDGGRDAGSEEADDSGVDEPEDGGPDAGDGDAGGDPLADGGATPDAGVIADAGPACLEGERRCSGPVPQMCTDGEFLDENPCPNVCIDGECAGSCDPGDTVCSGRERFVCDQTGNYPSTGSVCEFACASGECVGSCVPATHRCNALVPETCDVAGDWVAAAPCASFCLDGACVDCEPDTQRCSGLQLQTCSAEGGYDGAVETCPYICDPAGPACAGNCTPGFEACAGNVLQQCPSGTLTETPCTYVCNSSSLECAGECIPNDRTCSGDTPRLCGANGYFASQAPCAGGTPFCSGGNCVAPVVEGFPIAFTRDAAVSANYLIARRIPLTLGRRAVRIGIDVRSGAGSHLVAGVYTDAGGIPGNRLASTASTVTQAGAQELPLLSEADLGGVAVWIVFTFDAGTSVGFADLGITDTLHYTARAYDGTLPANFASGGNVASERYNLWLVARP